MDKEATRYVWEGAIPLQIHLHESEVTSLPPPPPAIILAPRIGYLPLLGPFIKPYFSDSLPPGADTVWFEYKGLPLKWYIPTGVLFDLLCAEPERPWNLTIHFRGYPGNILIPCEGEESVKWNFINSLKEAAYIINGNCKNIMNMSQSDQLELWHSVMNGNRDAYIRVSSKLKLGVIEDEYSSRTSVTPSKPMHGLPGTDMTGQIKTGRIPVRLYVRSMNADSDDLEDVPEVVNWDYISYINRPVEFHREEGKCFTLHDAIKNLLPEFFGEGTQTVDQIAKPAGGNKKEASGENTENQCGKDEEEEETEKHPTDSTCAPETAEIKFIRIQGIEPKPEIPFSWVANNLLNPEHFLHACVYVKVPSKLSNV